MDYYRNFLRICRSFFTIREDVIAAFISLAALIAWIIILFYKFTHFGYYDWDLAFFSQAMYSLTHGSQYVSLVGINFFGDHSYVIMLLLLPVFAILPHPLTLVVVKVLVYVAASALLYHAAKKSIGPSLAIFVQILYLVFPANVFSILYEFNPESLAPLFLFLMYDYFKKENIRAFVLVSLATVMIKENMLLVTLTFGLYALFDRQKNKLRWGVIPILASIVLLFIFVAIVIPYFRELPSHAFVVRYRQFGSTIGEIFSTMVFHPAKTFAYLCEPFNTNYLSDLFGPIAPLSLLSPHILFLILPIILQHLLSIHLPEHSIYFHYGVVIAPFIFLSALNTLEFISRKAKPVFYRYLVVLVFSLCFAHSLSFFEALVNLTFYHKDGLTETRQSFVNEVPKDAGVIATFDFLAELSLRKSLYSFHKVYDDYYQDPNVMKFSELYVGHPFVIPKDVSYALIDFNDHWLKKELDSNAAHVVPRIQRFLKENNWVVQKSHGGIVLYKREDGTEGKKN